MKKFIKKNKGVMAFVGVVLLLVVFTILVDGNQNNSSDSVEIDTTLLSDSIKQWRADTAEDEYVITVIGLSYCGYCADYHPIIEEIANNENITFHWYDIDTLYEENNEDGKALQYTFNLTNYSGSSPYTFVTKNGEFIGDTTGGMDEEQTLTFLKSLDVIE